MREIFHTWNITVSGMYTQFEKAAWIYWILEVITPTNSGVKISQSKTNDKWQSIWIIYTILIRKSISEVWKKTGSKDFTTVVTIKPIVAAATAAASLQSCPTLWPYRRQATRLPRPWDSPGKNTGVGYHFLLQCMRVKSESEVAQSLFSQFSSVQSLSHVRLFATPWIAAR